MHWQFKRIEEMYPDDDNVIRIVSIKTVKETYKQPLSKIYSRIREY